MNLDDTKMQERDFARVLWDYFSIHAKQRMQNSECKCLIFILY